MGKKNSFAYTDAQSLTCDFTSLGAICKQGHSMGFLFAFSLGVFSVAWWQQLPDQNLMLFALAALSLIWGVLRWSLWSQAMGCDYVANVELFMGQLLGTAGCLSEPWASVARGP